MLGFFQLSISSCLQLKTGHLSMLRTSSIFVLKVGKLLFRLDSLSTSLLVLSQSRWCGPCLILHRCVNFHLFENCYWNEIWWRHGWSFLLGPKKQCKDKNGMAQSSPQASAAMYLDKQAEAENSPSRSELTLEVLERARLDFYIKPPLLLTSSKNFQGSIFFPWQYPLQGKLCTCFTSCP